MTVRILTDVQKTVIAHMYHHENRRISDLAYDYKTSRRTIGRVLVECGVNKVQPPSSPPTTQEPVPKPTLYQQIKAFFGRLFS